MKTLFVCFLLAFTGMVYGQSLNDSLLLYYPMNGTCIDASGNGFDATSNTAVLTTDRYGNPNSAYSFNGVDTYINWPNDPALHPMLPITISFWVKYDVNDYLTTFLFDTDYEENNYSGIHCNLAPGMQVAFSFGDATGSTAPSARRSKVGTTQLVPGEWYFVVGVIRGAQDMDIYVNCENDGGYYDGTGGSMQYLGMPGTLGRFDGNTSEPTRYFDGSLDEFRLWNRALTSSDVEELCRLTSIETNETHQVGVYPNPAEEFIVLSNIPDDAERIDIVSMTGEIVITSDVQNKISVGALSEGLYFIRVIDNNGNIQSTERFVRF